MWGRTSGTRTCGRARVVADDEGDVARLTGRGDRAACAMYTPDTAVVGTAQLDDTAHAAAVIELRWSSSAVHWPWFCNVARCRDRRDEARTVAVVPTGPVDVDRVVLRGALDLELDGAAHVHGDVGGEALDRVVAGAVDVPHRRGPYPPSSSRRPPGSPRSRTGQWRRSPGRPPRPRASRPWRARRTARRGGGGRVGTSWDAPVTRGRALVERTCRARSCRGGSQDGLLIPDHKGHLGRR